MPGSAKKHDLVYLGKIFQRGDIGDFVVRRVLRDSFGSDCEWVEVSIEEPTAVARLQILWPANKPPSNVKYEIWKNKQRQIQRDITVQLQTHDDRKFIEYTAAHPEVDSVHQLIWSWQA
jgi:hypothetical protein